VFAPDFSNRLTVAFVTNLPESELSGSRRLVAIGFIDVVGYSRLMEADEAGTHEVWRSLTESVILPALATHAGEVIKSTGDGFLVVFRSAVEAVRWALKVQTDIASLNEKAGMALRIAIHIGDVVREENDIFGADVNIASRLQEFAEPGGIIVSAVVHERVRSVVEYVAQDLGKKHLKNIRHPVHAFGIRPGEEPSRVRRQPDPTQRQEPSIAVLPLRVLGNASVDPYLAEGMVHDIAESLAGLKDLFVISSSSTVVLANAVNDNNAIGRRLGAHYLVSGTVRRANTRLRLHVELSEVDNHRTRWQDRYDIDESQIFATQDAISSSIARALVPHLRQSELERALRKRPEDLGAYELVLQALHKLFRFREQDFFLARDLLEQAIERDPAYSAAYAWLAYWQIFKYGQGYSQDLDVDSREAQRLSLLALDHNPADPLALAVYGHTLSFLFAEYDRALESFDRAVTFSPSSAIAWGLSSPTHYYIGEVEQAIQRAERALALSPLDPLSFFFQTSLTISHYLSGNFEESIRWGQRTFAANPRYSANMRPLIASLAATERLDEARKVARALLEVEPQFRVSAFMARYPLQDRNALTIYGERLLAADLLD
jgi:class 3 adenylate cyclase/tetratricopeptide (TPR) repeat protein